MNGEIFFELKHKYGFVSCNGNQYAVVSTPFYFEDKPEILLEVVDHDGEMYDVYLARKKEYDFSENKTWNTYKLLDKKWQNVADSFTPLRMYHNDRRYD